MTNCGIIGSANGPGGTPKRYAVISFLYRKG